MPRLVVIESPFRGNMEVNIAYAKAALKDSLDRGEAPFAGHLLITQVLDDRIPEQREQGIGAHLAWLARADAVVVYQDLGISSGMQKAIDMAQELNVPIEYRRMIS